MSGIMDRAFDQEILTLNEAIYPFIVIGEDEV
jgi:hypothetical protein